MTPEDYDLSPELVALLQHCGALWDHANFGQWDPPEAEGEFEKACDRAITMLRTEVHPIKVKKEW